MVRTMSHFANAALHSGLCLSVLAACHPQSALAAPSAKPGPIANMTLHRQHPNESWTMPTLKGTHLTPQMPLVAETDDKPTFTRELVSVGWRPLESFNLYVVKPKGIKNPPVVLYLYDYRNDIKRFQNDDYCERITRSGCAAVGFESALSADRFQMRPMKEWFVSELPEALSESAHDVQMILNYLGTRGDLDMTKVGMFGQGSGASIAILAAGADPRIKALDLLNPWGNWPVWLKQSPAIQSVDRPALTRSAFLSAAAPLDPLIWLPRLKDRKIRLIQVKDDGMTPGDCQAALAKAVPVGTQVVQYDSNLAVYGALGHGRLFAWVSSRIKTAGQ